MKCPKCESDTFYAVQVISGTLTVVVNENGEFLRNGADGGFDESCLEFDSPEGPYECTECHTVLDELVKQRGR